ELKENRSHRVDVGILLDAARGEILRREILADLSSKSRLREGSRHSRSEPETDKTYLAVVRDRNKTRPDETLKRPLPVHGRVVGGVQRCRGFLPDQESMFDREALVLSTDHLDQPIQGASRGLAPGDERYALDRVHLDAPRDGGILQKVVDLAVGFDRIEDSIFRDLGRLQNAEPDEASLRGEAQ